MLRQHPYIYTLSVLIQDQNIGTCYYWHMIVFISHWETEKRQRERLYAYAGHTYYAYGGHTVTLKLSMLWVLFQSTSINSSCCLSVTSNWVFAVSECENNNSLGFCKWARASPTLRGSDGSPGWLSPPHLPLSGVSQSGRVNVPKRQW